MGKVTSLLQSLNLGRENLDSVVDRAYEEKKSKRSKKQRAL